MKRGTSSDPFYSLDRRDGVSKHWTSDPWKGRATFRFPSSSSTIEITVSIVIIILLEESLIKVTLINNHFQRHLPYHLYLILSLSLSYLIFTIFILTLISFERTGSSLHLGRLEEGDGGVYRCQVDYSQVSMKTFYDDNGDYSQVSMMTLFVV